MQTSTYTYIYVDTDNSSGQSKIPCRTPQSGNKEKPGNMRSVGAIICLMIGRYTKVLFFLF